MTKDRKKASKWTGVTFALAALGAPAFAHVTEDTDLKNEPHWYTKPFDLRFDSKWVNFPGGKVGMNEADEVFFEGAGDYAKPAFYGIRFALGPEWEKFASGHKVKVTLTTRSSSKGPSRFKVAYLTNDVGTSGWYEGIANSELSTFSFIYRVPPMIKGNNDFLVVIPEVQNTPIYIVRGTLELVE